jgi:AAA15 family ATPase/GTPase
MIKKLEIRNYRCFEKCEINFKDLTIAVGRNNAGKSTLIEALRIVSVGVNRSSSINYTSAPYWLSIDKDLLGISPSIENLDISTNNIFYLYGSPPSLIKTYFTNGVIIDTFVGDDAKIFVVIYDQEGKNIVSKRMAKDLNLSPINILPQISPILREEPILKFTTVQRNLDTKLSSRNFRNQLKYYYSDFEKFRKIAESTWHGLALRDLENRNEFVGNLLLMIRDNNFIAEIGWMGHGLQMWLQTMWFLSRCEVDSTVILDEPDVYMHADLQRRLIRFIKGKHKQILIATHSVEIMAEVEPDNILPVESSKTKLAYANKTPIVQKIIDDIGSVHNLEIARLFSHKKFLIVEGDIDDIKILSIFQGLLCKDSLEPFDILPKTFVEGWGGWQRVIGSNKVFSDNKTEIKTYCIFDSDYHTDSEVESRLKEASNIGLNLHIWSKKEIENFLIVPTVIHRIIVQKRRRKKELTLEDLKSQLNIICESFKEGVIDDFATEFQAKDKSIVVKTANQKARDYINSKWEREKIGLIPGKKFISSLSSWTNSEYRVNLNAFKIAREFKKEEIPKEIVKIILTIEKGEGINYSL